MKRLKQRLGEWLFELLGVDEIFRMLDLRIRMLDLRIDDLETSVDDVGHRNRCDAGCCY